MAEGFQQSLTAMLTFGIRAGNLTLVCCDEMVISMTDNCFQTAMSACFMQQV